MGRNKSPFTVRPKLWASWWWRVMGRAPKWRGVGPRPVRDGLRRIFWPRMTEHMLSPGRPFYTGFDMLAYRRARKAIEWRRIRDERQKKVKRVFKRGRRLSVWRV